MIEERSTRLLEQLERRAAALLAALRESRVQQDALHTRLAELESRRVELEASNAELAAEMREEQAGRAALAERCGILEARLAELEATRLELAEENRELDEQNRELEAHNRRLLEREPAEAGGALFHRQARRAQGLSALIGHRPRQPEDAEAAHEPPASAAPNALSVPEPSLEAAEPVPQANVPSEPPAAEASVEETAPEDAPSPQALLDQWYQRYSSTFFKGHTRPLKVGIHEELAQLEPWPEKLVRRALACYVNLPRYLKSVRERAERLDLTGEPAGLVDAAAAEHARKKLDRLQADRRQKGRPARQNSGKKGDTAKGGKPRADATRHDAARKATASSRPEPAPAESAGLGVPPGREPATLEEKLSALLSKHNQH
ncbi:ProQ/FINO family protein [Halomonas daqiaonensis]|uniref:ProP effector n=1 Tax=Halomonas daqiaonensis TaxID=650850 RepID=A0A1H7MBT9_9GAMM|nr:ProQ/FINO family protein [Halomonas daqiaonensis]SEL08663.1 ProP effector [Halomonas daqiaonensis]